MDILIFYLKILMEMADWRTFLDIPIIALGIFFLYHTLRTSGGWRIVLGVTGVVFVFVIAKTFNLTGITWIYSNLSNIALIAIIIIFQPEIRKIFENTVSTFRMKKTGRAGNWLSLLIANSAFLLTQKKWGGIIVLPGKDPIKPKVSGGIKLNASPSLALIASIFDPHSSGHDGAIVIENGIIKQFALRLPLSVSGKLGNDYGTRHHAAMGLAENSDSLVIVVSEERGKVTIFNDGKFVPMEDKKKLSAWIESHWSKTDSFWPGKRNFKKWGLTLMEMTSSLIAAFVLWSFITFGTTNVRELSFAVPIEYLITSSDIVITGEKPTAVRIRVSGSAADINQIKPSELKAAVDLSGAKSGKQLITISKNSINLPARVSLIDSEPSVFEITLQSFTEKEVLIKPQLVGIPPKGFDISSIEINPEKIKILYSTDQKTPGDIFLATTPIYLPEIKDDIKLYCNLIAPPNIYPVGKQWPDVMVTIKLKAVKILK